MSRKYNKLYKLFRDQLDFTDKEARQSVKLVGSLIKGEYHEQASRFATKEDLKQDLNATRDELKKEMDGVRQEIRNVERNLEVKMTKSIFWAGVVQFLAMVGAIISIVHFMINK